MEESKNFICEFVEEDIAEGGRFEGQTVHTRFPPEPNGYLHIGHAKAICIDFTTAEKYGGLCNLRFDDTNPVKEDTEYVDAIQEDIKWLGFNWDDRMFYASDYFETMYNCAETLIKKGLAYVCELSADEIREYRGTLTEPGKESPYRNRSVEENLDLFRRMRAGEFADGSMILRAKIDMASPNINMRDPALYRILHTHHHKAGDKWCIYPMYDFAHPIEDSIENVTHSLCSLEFENHRPLYDWVLENVELPCKSRQIEFARFNLTYTIMSKRYLMRLVKENFVNGWDDPRMPTLCGLRRRGYTPESIRNFMDKVGVSKAISTVDYALLEYCIREDLNAHAERGMAVLDPIKLIIDNYPDDLVEEFEFDVNTEDENAGKRKVYFSKEMYIERDDFCEEPPKGYFRMFPGNEVRLKHAYYVKCTGCDKDENGNVIAVHGEYDPESRGGWIPGGRKVKGTMHWVSAHDAVDAEIRIYDHLFSVEDPGDSSDGKDFTEKLNPNSLTIISGAKVEPYLANAKPGDKFQFLRMGYFSADYDHTAEKPVFNRTVTLKDTYKPAK